MERLLQFRHVAEKLDMSLRRAWALRSKDKARFPKPVPVPGSNPRWLESELDRYIALLAADRDGVA